MFRKFCSTVLVSIRGENDNLVSTPSSNLNSCINECAKYNYKSASEIASGDKDRWYVIWFAPAPMLNPSLLSN